MNKGTKHWTAKEKEFIFTHLGKLSYPEMGRRLNRTERAVHLLILRSRRSPKTVIRNNLILAILEAAFTNPEYFTPTRSFYQAVQIGQKRWWSLYRGVLKATEEECLRVMRHLRVDPETLAINRQLDLFE